MFFSQKCFVKKNLAIRYYLKTLNVAPMVTMTCKGVFDGTLTLKVWNTVLIATMVIMTGNW